MLYLWQLTCAFGSAVAFAACVSDAAGRKRILPFTRDWVARSSQTLRTGKRSPASGHWKSWLPGSKSRSHSFLGVSEYNRFAPKTIFSPPENLSDGIFGQAYNGSLRRSLADPYLVRDLRPGASLRAKIGNL